MRPCSWKRPSVVLVCAMAAAMVFADQASAGTYVVRNCNVPGERRAPVGSWQWSAGGGTFANDDCAGGGGFGLNAGTMPAGYAASVFFPTTPGIVIRRVRLWLVARLAGTGSSLYVATQSGTGSEFSPAVGVFGPPGGETLTTPFTSALLPSDTRVFGVYVNCSADAGVGCTPSASAVLDIKGAELTLEESAAPTGTIDGGDLLSVGPRSGTRSLDYSAADAQSGIMRVAVVIGTTTAGALDFAGDCAYVTLAACAPSRSGSVAVDTSLVPDGIYPVTLRVTDAAGNERSVQAATGIQVANGVAAVTGQLPAATASAQLTVSFASNRRSAATVGYSRRALVRGRLRTAAGTPIPNAVIEVEERRAGRARPTLRTRVITGRDGRFSHTARRGPSRTIVVGYPSTIGGAASTTRRLKLRVKASASLRVTLRGVSVRYRGRVLSKPVPARGKVVEIQGRAPGAGWKTFAKRRTTERGTYSGRYRLRVHRPGVRLQFRVRIPREAGYPFVSHTGRALTRRVR